MSKIHSYDIKALYASVSPLARPLSTTANSLPVMPIPTSSRFLSTSTGLITQAYGLQELQSRIMATELMEERTSTFQLSTSMSLPVSTVEGLLGSLDEGEWARVLDGSTVVTAFGWRLLMKDVDEALEGAGVVDVSAWCLERKVDSGLFWRLAKRGGWNWVSVKGRELVCGKKFWEAVNTMVEERIVGLVRPVQLSALYTDSDVPVALLKKIVIQLIKTGLAKGWIEADRFIPDVYMQERHAELERELRMDGILAMEKLRSERINSPEEFIKQRVPEAQLLETCFVTADYLSKTQHSVMSRVDEQGWCDIKDVGCQLPLKDIKVLLQIIVKAHRKLQEIAGVVVSRTLEHELRDNVRLYAHDRAQNAWKRRSPGKLLDICITLSELSRFLCSENPLPQGLLLHFTTLLHPYAISEFNWRYDELRKSAINSSKSVFLDKYQARIQIHSSALCAITDPSLKFKLALDLLQYACESGMVALEKLENVLREDPNANLQSLQDFREVLRLSRSSKKPEDRLKEVDHGLRNFLIELEIGFLDGDSETQKKRAMMEEINNRLQNTNDLSLALLSTLLLVLGANNEGLLKATGKYVPKLLKEVQSAGIVTAEQASVMTTIKAAVLGKGKASEEDIKNLKLIGAQCIDRNQSVG